jgi:hypothetical protein
MELRGRMLQVCRELELWNQLLNFLPYPPDSTFKFTCATLLWLFPQGESLVDTMLQLSWEALQEGKSVLADIEKVGDRLTRADVLLNIVDMQVRRLLTDYKDPFHDMSAHVRGSGLIIHIPDFCRFVEICLCLWVSASPTTFLPSL